MIPEVETKEVMAELEPTPPGSFGETGGERQGREGCLPAGERAIYKEALGPAPLLRACSPVAPVDTPG